MGFRATPPNCLEHSLPTNKAIKNCQGIKKKREKPGRILSMSYPLVCLLKIAFLLSKK